ncbi:MAG TPA: hypothetical protein VEC39_14630 [Vicinamibacterales bacterium]|nr:hypothetical protein [Vicinamibacterales bacterium]
MEKNHLRQIAERVISNLEEMSLPKTDHADREAMVNEVQGVIQTHLLEFGYVRLVKPGE